MRERIEILVAILCVILGIAGAVVAAPMVVTITMQMFGSPVIPALFGVAMTGLGILAIWAGFRMIRVRV